jgi:hypothetical protein
MHHLGLMTAPEKEESYCSQQIQRFNALLATAPLLLDTGGALVYNATTIPCGPSKLDLRRLQHARERTLHQELKEQTFL